MYLCKLDSRGLCDVLRREKAFIFSPEFLKTDLLKEIIDLLFNYKRLIVATHIHAIINDNFNNNVISNNGDTKLFKI